MAAEIGDDDPAASDLCQNAVADLLAVMYFVNVDRSHLAVPLHGRSVAVLACLIQG